MNIYLERRYCLSDFTAKKEWSQYLSLHTATKLQLTPLSPENTKFKSYLTVSCSVKSVEIQLTGREGKLNSRLPGAYSTGLQD